jgi:hypothetical protein
MMTGVDTIDIGSDADTFTAYHDFDMPHIVFGGQGASMMGLRLRLTGPVPACLVATIAYEDGGQGMDTSSVKTYQESDGSFTTKPLWVPGYFPSLFTVHSTVGGKDQRVHLGTPDDM